MVPHGLPVSIHQTWSILALFNLCAKSETTDHWSYILISERTSVVCLGFTLTLQNIECFKIIMHEVDP